MCHRRGDWSRTSSRASDSEDEPNEERAWWGTAKERLVTFVSVTEDETTGERPDRPAVDADPETPSVETEGEEADESDEREEDPIPADD